ncbi:MAG: hypothetical protein AAGA48_37230 [Myxococcota bacterium]
MNLDDLVAESDSIVLGTVVDTHSVWDPQGRIILTDATIKVEHSLLGDAKAVTEVRTFGGRVDDYTVLAHGFPTFDVGNRIVVFLQAAEDGTQRVTGYQHGLYKVVQRQGTPWVVPTVDDHSVLSTKDYIKPSARHLAAFTRDILATETRLR